jgi:hypothetical protein
METTLLGASRTTHLKIVFVSLVAATIVVAVGISARINTSNVSETGLVKAGQPATFAAQDTAAIR